MKLGIISDAHHYYNEKGQLCALDILTRQFEQWAGLFEQVIICAPLLSGMPTDRHKPYPVDNIHLLPIKNAGGNTILAKFDLIYKSFGWWKAIRKLLNQVDAVHIRCPNNVSILGLIALQFTNLPRQAVYTGSWLGGAPVSYRLQRAFLKRHFNGPVAVYGEWPDQPDHIIPSFSPSYYQKDWDMESQQVAARIKWLENSEHLAKPVQLVTVGSLNKNKNQSLIIDTIKYLRDSGFDCHLHILGGGSEQEALEQKVEASGLGGHISFHGYVSHDIVRQYYRQADFVVQAPYSEGFGKVPIEAFFHGVVPILSDVDMSSQIVGNGLRGRCFPQNDVESIAAQIMALSNQPGEMAFMIKAGRIFAKDFALEAWQQHIQDMLTASWKIDLGHIDTEF